WCSRSRARAGRRGAVVWICLRTLSYFSHTVSSRAPSHVGRYKYECEFVSILLSLSLPPTLTLTSSHSHLLSLSPPPTLTSSHSHLLPLSRHGHACVSAKHRLVPLLLLHSAVPLPAPSPARSHVRMLTVWLLIAHVASLCVQSCNQSLTSSRARIPVPVPLQGVVAPSLFTFHILLRHCLHHCLRHCLHHCLRHCLHHCLRHCLRHPSHAPSSAPTFSTPSCTPCITTIACSPPRKPTPSSSASSFTPGSCPGQKNLPTPCWTMAWRRPLLPALRWGWP
ncbi:unnamed protein product, partial [Closterium sp. Naga37s-1]